MKNLKELLQNEELILFEIKEEDKISFLEYAKENSCTWVNGTEIKLKKDDCWVHMAISDNLTLGKIGLLCWAYSIKTTKPYKYEK